MTTRLPNSAKAKRAGIGVAVRNSASGASPFSRSAATLLDAETLLLVDDDKRAVTEVRYRLQPARASRTRRQGLLHAHLSTMLSRSCGAVEPVSTAEETPAVSNSGPSDAKCWRAKISVGAMNSACFPLSALAASAKAATIVFPVPTSPKSMWFAARAGSHLPISRLSRVLLPRQLSRERSSKR